jgi:ADP-ribose pyrophosphatase YjhB (NUDIX family)
MENQPQIRVKSLAWIEDQGELFVVKMQDSIKKDYYYRPVGGSVEFGETAVEAVKREAMEELKAKIEVTGENPMVVQNLFVCDGKKGHEIDFLVPCRFRGGFFYQRGIFQLVEADGMEWPAMWVSIADFLSGKYRLVPENFLNWYKPWD